MTKQSRLSHITSVKYCLIRPSFFGPRHTTGSSRFGNIKPIDMTARLSSRQTGVQPVLLLCTSLPSNPSMRGTDGPQRSMSNKPTSTVVSYASARASYVDTVDFPTPPLPESTSTTFLTPANFIRTSSTTMQIHTRLTTYNEWESFLRLVLPLIFEEGGTFSSID